MCEKLNQNLVESRQGQDNLPYAYDRTEWFSYENVNSLTEKARYIIEKQLGGAIMLAIDTDDFSGSFCNQGK
jgi:GH18 family chitinase